MNRYVVFEAGSRAGLSAELFFRAWRKQNAWKEGQGDILYLADSDPVYRSIPSDCSNIIRISDNDAIELIVNGNAVVFPADELTRQCNFAVMNEVNGDRFSMVSDLWYDKAHVNNVLSELVSHDKCAIRIPLTFGLTDTFIKPNRASAGSKGIEMKGDVCVSQYIKIQKEYVVDVLCGESGMQVFPREVKLRSGYDKMIKLLNPYGTIAREVAKFIDCVTPKMPLFAPGIFHIQLAEDVNGDLYYIESSRRISGTSIVNLANGFNPFCFMNGVEADSLVHKFKFDEWFRYEDFVLDVENIIRSII